MITAPTNPTKVAILQILLAGPAPGLDIQRAMQGDDLPNLLRPSAPYHASPLKVDGKPPSSR